MGLDTAVLAVAVIAVVFSTVVAIFQRRQSQDEYFAEFHVAGVRLLGQLRVASKVNNLAEKQGVINSAWEHYSSLKCASCRLHRFLAKVKAIGGQDTQYKTVNDAHNLINDSYALGAGFNDAAFENVFQDWNRHFNGLRASWDSWIWPWEQYGQGRTQFPALPAQQQQHQPDTANITAKQFVLPNHEVPTWRVPAANE
jgi:hypothetical protein